MIRNKRECDKCNKEFSLSNFKKHYEKCNGNKKINLSELDIIDGKYSCPYCDLSFSKFGISNHIKQTHKGIDNGMKGKTPWNKGLNKENNSSVLDMSKKISIIMKEKSKKGLLSKPFSKDYWTDEERKKKSEEKKKFFEENPEMHPNRLLANNRNNMSYPEKIAYDYLTKLDVDFEHQKKILNYYPDFVISNNIIIEIDGEYWHPIGNEKDRIRDLELNNLGYKVYRIRSKEKIEQRIDEILHADHARLAQW